MATTVELMQERDIGLYGKFRGIVRDREDPLGLKRIRAQIPRLGEDEGTGEDYITFWALPCGIPQGDFTLPEIGEMVWIEFEAGNPEIPIWQFGSHTVDDKTPRSKTVPTQNKAHSRRIIGHPNGSGLIMSAKRGDESVFMTDVSGNNKSGVGSGQISWFIEVENHANVDVGGNWKEVISGTYDSSVGGNYVQGIIGNYVQSIGTDREVQITNNDLLIVQGQIINASFDDQVIQVLDELNKSIAEVKLGKDNSVQVTIKSQTGKTGKLSLIPTASGETKFKVETTGDVDVDSGGKVTLKGTPMVHPDKTVAEVVHGGTINPFTGLPYNKLPTFGTPQGVSTTVKVSK